MRGGENGLFPVSGYMLLSYAINNGAISWKVIDSHLDV